MMSANNPVLTIVRGFPFQRRMKIIEENTALAVTAGRHQDCDANKPIPPTIKPAAATAQKIPARILTGPSPILESDHEPSGQFIPGLS